MPDYFDTSAFLKFILVEPESRAFRADTRARPERVSSALLLVEGARAAARYGSVAESRARSAMDRFVLVPLDDPVLQAAADLEPSELRSLDALHLATALSLGDDLERFYCYDARLGQAAAGLGIDVRAPAEAQRRPGTTRPVS
ncbi:MAG: type II toxin-antitoxin system VapC family toxin [Solirubrobacterales bacterium]|nr:type II toxin-antitoxin system VapC family toxin [Solirubrobacterales bacterium]